MHFILDNETALSLMPPKTVVQGLTAQIRNHDNALVNVNDGELFELLSLLFNESINRGLSAAAGVEMGAA